MDKLLQKDSFNFKNELEQEEEFYTGTIYSKRGMLYQLAYADNSAQNSEYQLFIRCKDGWLVVNEGSEENLKKIQSNYNSFPTLHEGLIPGVINGHIYNKAQKYYGKFFGHWFSRRKVEELLIEVGNSIAGKKSYKDLNSSQKGKVYLAQSLRAVRDPVSLTSSNYNINRSKFRPLFSNDQGPGMPLVGHSLIMITPYDKGFLIKPSGIYQVDSLIYLGGGSSEEQFNKTNSFLKILGFKSGLKEENLKDSFLEMEKKTLEKIISELKSDETKIGSYNFKLNYFEDKNWSPLVLKDSLKTY